MSKKLVVITGSPRKNGNSFAMADAFIKAAQANGHIITRFDAAFKKVGGCHACETCYKTGKACSFDDDFNELAPSILEADGVVFITPVYWYSYPAQIKGVIDKLYSLCVGGKDVAGKECALITCCEENDMSVMDGVRVFKMEIHRRGACPRRVERRGRLSDKRLRKSEGTCGKVLR